MVIPGDYHTITLRGQILYLVLSETQGQKVLGRIENLEMCYTGAPFKAGEACLCADGAATSTSICLDAPLIARDRSDVCIDAPEATASCPLVFPRKPVAG